MLVLFSACSTQRNTRLSRNYQAFATRFNIAFNGNEAFNEGLRNIVAANEDDFSDIIPLFPISNHSNASAAASNMDRAIEKSRKAIRTRSIRVRPQRDLRRWNDPEYRIWYNQNEFNPALKDAWMLLGKAEFHKAEFLASVGTFMYIKRWYPEDADLVARCQLWMVRAYVEMGWLYEADEMLRRVNQDDMRTTTIGLFAAANATLLLARNQHREAIPFVELMISRERDRAMRRRFTFVLAQLFEATGETQSAIDTYTAVIRMNPPYVMEFNARINRAQLSAGNNLDGVLRELNRMARNPNNKDFLDQVYFAIGNAHLNNGDTIRAIENFNRSVELSTRHGMDKAITLITLGDLFYGKRQYVKAQPPFSEASQILSHEHDEFRRVSRLATVLSELVMHYEVVVLQDSLQHLATLSRAEQLAVVNRIIADKIAEEQRTQQQQEREEHLARNAPQEQRFTPVGGPRGANVGRWYFYNPELVRTGRTEFQRQWGNRRLEDNWRRSNRATAMFADTETDGNFGDVGNFENFGENADFGGDGVQAQGGASLTDRNPEYYLRQIPSTPQQIEHSNAQIADALFAMAGIFKDRINDFPMAVETYLEFIRRFGQEPRVPDAYFQLFLTETRQEHPTEAELYRQRILRNFPDTRFAQLLRQPDFVGRFHLMQQKQDSLYRATYLAYINNQFQTVVDNVDFARRNFPASRLMPQFTFLEALTIGKTDTPENFAIALNDLIETFPESAVSSMARDIAAFIRQGMEAQGGSSHGTLISRRGDELREFMEEGAEFSGEQAYSTNTRGKHRLMLISDAEQQEMFQFMFQVAAYNFTRFVIKEFDLELARLDDTHQILSVTNFEAFDEVVWYLNSMVADLRMKDYFSRLAIQPVIISEENFALMRILGFDDYLLFKAQYLDDPNARRAITASARMPERIPEIVNEQERTNAQPHERTNARTHERTNEQPEQQPEIATIETPQPQIEQEPLELFEGLFAFEPQQPHYVAIYILSGNINFDRFKADLDAYNYANYTMLNLDISLERVGNRQVIIIGSFGDANMAKSYLLRMVQERELFEGLRGSNHRNLFGTQRNLNVMMHNNALNAYMRFIQEFYMD